MRRRMVRAVAASAVAAVVLVPFPAQAGGGGHCPEPLPQIEPGRVLILDSCFAPSNQQIATGESVIWDASKAQMAHTVTFQNLNSGDVAGTFGARFDQPGTYAFACAYHPGMIGSVTVEGPATGEVPIVALSEMRPMTGKIHFSDDLPADDPVPASAVTKVQEDTLTFSLGDWRVIAAVLALMVLVSATAATVAVRVSRR